MPQDGSTAFDHYRDNAHVATSVIDMALPGYSGMIPKVAVGGSLFVSSGQPAFQLLPTAGPAKIPFTRHLSWNSEWR